MYVHFMDTFCADVTVSMVNSGTITQTEGDGNVGVCARLVSPSGGVATTVTVVFTWTGASTGRNTSVTH